MEDQIIYIAEPIASDIQASLKTTEISHETIETKTNASSFFSDRTIVRSMKKKTKRKFNPPFLAGNLSKNKNQGIMKASEAKKLKTNATQCQTRKCANLSKVNKAELKTVKIKSTKVKTTEVKKEQNMKESEKNEKPIASTSGIQNKKGGPISLLDSEDSFSDALQ